MKFKIDLNIEHQLLIGKFLNSPLRKAYTGGIAGVIGKNKKVLTASSSIADFQLNVPADILKPGNESFLKAAVTDDGERDFYKIDYTFTDVKALQNFRTEAFKLAGVGSYKLMKELREIAADVTKNNNQNTELFNTLARKKMLEYIPVKDVPPKGWLETNYNTGVGSSYHAAEFIRLQEPLLQKIYPAYKYMTRKDKKVRKAHWDLHGLIFMQDDKIWLIIYPPNGWNCRCFIIPIDAHELSLLLAAKDENVMSDLSVSERGRIVKSAEITPEFMRNPGAVQSIWDKIIDSELKEIDFEEVQKAMRDYADSNRIPDDKLPAIDIVKLQEANAQLGKYEKRDVRDVEKEILVLDINPVYQDAVLRVLKNPSEIWGKDFMENGVKNSELYYLQHNRDGVAVVTVLNGEVVETKNVSLEYVGKHYRINTLIYLQSFGKLQK